MRYVASIVIQRPPDEVYEYLADLRHDPEWRAVTSSELVDGVAGSEGARYRQEVGDDEVVVEVTEANPAIRTVSTTTVDDPDVTTSGTFVVSPFGDGACSVQFACEVRTAGTLSRLATPFLARRFRRQVRYYLDSLQWTLMGGDTALDLDGGAESAEGADASGEPTAEGPPPEGDVAG